MNSQNTQQLTEDIQKEISQSLNNSESSSASKNDGISEDNYNNLQSHIDLNKTELNYPNGKKDVQDFAEGILHIKKELNDCVIDANGRRKCH
ncbi:MAG: hypothetical protein RMY16_07470 [Nostoc sp. DedQUE12b]|uniref:hypothetical protein n=1 Tax=Nostoc sp. DedQUE12b TaxID=3075398 RepID=UPI002AD3736B|nr:hypothetical protein [Nostoc sp. DedQUE12b]MDZ8085420.1 hypothetical protein [Nostoc sp. DedQUE12b]